MFQNYLKTAIRNLLRNKLFSAINIVGLAIGLAAFILILLFVRDERSWDDHWNNAEDLYRVESTYVMPDREDRRVQAAPHPVKDLMIDTFAEVMDVTRFIGARMSIRVGEELVSEYVMVVEPNLPEFFGMEFVEGDPQTALSDPAGIVISESAAARLFGHEFEVGFSGKRTYLGKTLESRSRGTLYSYYVAGVIKDPVHDTHLRHDVLVPFDRKYFDGSRWFTEGWNFAYWQTYAKFQPGTNLDIVRAELPAVIERAMPENGQGMETGSNWKLNLNLMPLGNVHLYRSYDDENPATLYGLISIAFLILIIAVVNFLNLSMARTVYRAREVAMRKVLGAGRMQIIQQFLGESILLALVSLIFALAMVEMALPYYNAFLTSMVDPDWAGQPTILLAVVLLGVVVGLSAGSMQSLYFSVLKPRDVLYSSTAPDNRTSKLRMGLVVAQFSISLTLMVIAFFVNKQVEYARSLDLGFNANDLIVVSGTSGDQSNDFKLHLLESPYIEAVGRSSDVPTEGSEDRVQIRPITGGDTVQLDGLPTGPDFFKAYDIPLLAGRYLTNNEADVTRRRGEEGAYREAANIVINASGAKLLGFATPQEALGQIVTTDVRPEQRLTATIVGVVGDFHFDSARSVIRPGIYYVDDLRQADMSVRIDGANRAEAIAHIQDVWQATFPDGVLRYRIMKDMVERQYQADDRLGGVLTAFTLLAILVSCLGLYGLASFTVERRTKEIGIRKVLGANIKDIVALLLWQFAKPILISNLIAWPVAFYFLSDWLRTFVYRIELDLMPFLMFGTATLLIGWLTVAGRAFMVARTNPISALRYE